MSDTSASSGGSMDIIYVTELEPWLLVVQVRALVLESLGLHLVELLSIS